MFIVILVTVTLFVSCATQNVPKNEAIDSNYLESVLDPEECDRQLQIIANDVNLRLRFLDAGLRVPKGITLGNAVDLGNYHQCLGIQDETNIHGKYCIIFVPVEQNLDILDRRDINMSPSFNPYGLYADEEDKNNIDQNGKAWKQITSLNSNYDEIRINRDDDSGLEFRLATCIPKPCSPTQAVNNLLFNTSEPGLLFSENFCRLPGDKPWVPADTVATVIFSIFGILTVLSTAYDLCHRFKFKKDIKEAKELYLSFSVYTNGITMTTFPKSGKLQCLDGIRTLASTWVVLGHTFSTSPTVVNPTEAFAWMYSSNALWATMTPMMVDTFFTLTGLLIVYTNAAKMNATTFLKDIHWFYINRLVRITPLLAVTVLLQASYLNWLGDGPNWTAVVANTNACRTNWWSTLIHLQNFINPNSQCASHAWYIAIDMQLYIISPLVLCWVLTGNKRYAWTSLSVGLLISMIFATVTNFLSNVKAAIVVPSRTGEDSLYYHERHYANIFARSPPFFIGLMFGYVLHINRKRKIRLTWYSIASLWLAVAWIFGSIVYFKNSLLDLEWDNQFVDNFMNTFMRPAWGIGVCCVIFACVNGYGGPVNWFLCWDIWKMPARLSYGVYLFHYLMMFVIQSKEIAPIYFSVSSYLFKFLGHFLLSLIVSFFFTLVIDSPISLLVKQGQKKCKGVPVNESVPKTEDSKL